jgi:hypothetical protein
MGQAKMGPIHCPETSEKERRVLFLEFLTLEDGTNTLLQNASKGLPFNAA